MTKTIIDTLQYSMRHKIKGKEFFNLEITLKKDFPLDSIDDDDLWEINDYLGDFIVTDFGYLIPGSNNNLGYKRFAEIRDNNFLSRHIIHFENGEMDTIIEVPFLGKKLMQLAYSRDKIKERRYQPVGLALA
jgi:hypothetical protein